MEKPDGYDEVILESIREGFKTGKQISDETGISYTRVMVRLAQLRSRNEVFAVETNKQGKLGVKPLKYRKMTRREEL